MREGEIEARQVRNTALEDIYSTVDPVMWTYDVKNRKRHSRSKKVSDV